jgi:hypothetical protein
MSEPDLDKRRRARNLVLGLVLAGLVALFYGMTIVRLGGHGQ